MENLKFINNGIKDQLQGMVNRANAMQGFLNRNIYRMYQNAQRDRWITENQSEGRQWDKLSPGYSKYKPKKYANYPGGGRKMMIATGRLAAAAQGKSPELYKIATNKQLILTIKGIEYASHADESRTISKWSNETMDKMYKAISDFAFHNILKGL